MNLLSVSSVLNTILAVVLAIVILLAMITIHEFGHYTAGKILKFKINEFAIGFGPKLFRRTSKRNGEAFSVRLLPLGGFCAFEGGDADTLNPASFNNKAPWKRIIVLLSGPLMNYILAVLLIIISFFSFGQMLFKVGAVAPVADESYIGYTLQENDLILNVDGEGIYLVTDMMGALKGKHAGDEVKVKLIRGGKKITTVIKLQADCDFKNSEEVGKIWRALGVGTVERNDGSYWNVSADSYRLGFFDTIGSYFIYSFKIAGTIFKVLGELLTGHIGLSAMGGPVTTIKLTSELATQSVQSFLEIAAYIGVNLAVFNLLPIPALDGSKVVFCLIEWIFRKPVPSNGNRRRLYIY